MGKIKFKVSVNPGLLASEVMRKKLYNRFVDGLLDAAQEFQEGSPVGATASLKRGWDVTAPRRETVTFTVNAAITNDAPNALFRIAGRGPGKMPPYAPIFAWTSAKGFPEKTQAIRRNIALFGTKRWQSKTNWVGITNQNKRIPNGRLEQIEQQIAEDLNA